MQMSIFIRLQPSQPLPNKFFPLNGLILKIKSIKNFKISLSAKRILPRTLVTPHNTFIKPNAFCPYPLLSSLIASVYKT